MAPRSSGGARGALTRSGPSPVGRLNSVAFNTFRNAVTLGLGSSPDAGSALATDTRRCTRTRSRISARKKAHQLVIWDVNAVSEISTKVSGLRYVGDTVALWMCRK
ncbi:hypothetical protein BJY52DRAFT_1421614 [Lactarius psammicola]|nr:hypothetical protein BJY52DRAFT_1421614 [Lactarius psammicola]